MEFMKRLAVVSAIGVTGMGLAAVPAQASPAGAAAKGHHFACSNVSRHSAPCHDSTVRVRSGQRLRVTVRGSKGFNVKFHAVGTNGDWIGHWSHYLEHGDPPVTVWKNRTHHTVTVHLRAAVKIPKGISVYGTEYVHR